VTEAKFGSHIELKPSKQQLKCGNLIWQVFDKICMRVTEW